MRCGAPPWLCQYGTCGLAGRMTKSKRREVSGFSGKGGVEAAASNIGNTSSVIKLIDAERGLMGSECLVGGGLVWECVFLRLFHRPGGAFLHNCFCTEYGGRMRKGWRFEIDWQGCRYTPGKDMGSRVLWGCNLGWIDAWPWRGSFGRCGRDIGTWSQLVSRLVYFVDGLSWI